MIGGLWRTSVAAGLIAVFLGGPAWAAQEAPQAVSAELRKAFEQLTGPDPSERAAAFDIIRKSKGGALVPALEAYRNGMLERRSDGHLIIYANRVEIAGSNLFPLVDAWTLQPIAGPDGAPTYAKAPAASMPDAAGRPHHQNRGSYSCRQLKNG